MNELEEKILNEDGFYLRIRKEETINGIVYYNGFKPFTIDKNKKIKPDLKKFLSINSKNITKTTKKELEETIIKKRKDIYGKFELTEVYFEKGKVCNSKEITQETKNKSNQKYNEILESIKEELKDAVEINEKRIKIKKTSYEVEYKILDYLYNKSKINGEYNNNKKQTFSVFKIKPPKYSMILKNNIELDKMCEDIKMLISKYEDYTDIEKEKKYQHFFLIHDFNKTEYKDIFNENVLPFECEYYIDEKKKDGRIDAIFYSYKDKTITDLYLIELKVDTKVLGGSNGIHKHLLDIKNINKLNHNFYNDLEARIKYRHEFIYKQDLEFEKNYNKYFYIITGQCDTTKKEIINSLKTLNNIKKDKLERKVDLKENYAEYNNKPVKNILKEINNDIKIKLFIDENTWNKKIDSFNPNYKDYTYLLEDKKV